MIYLRSLFSHLVYISKDFPLIKEGYVFVIYGEQMCVGRVITVYFEAYSNHYYTEQI